LGHHRSSESCGVRNLDGCSAILLGQSQSLGADAGLNRSGDGDGVRNLNCCGAVLLSHGLRLRADASHNWVRRAGDRNSVRNLDGSGAVPLSQGLRLGADASHDWVCDSNGARNFTGVIRSHESSDGSVADCHGLIAHVGTDNSLRSHDGSVCRRESDRTRTSSSAVLVWRTGTDGPRKSSGAVARQSGRRRASSAVIDR
jgi:hypothetical protein